MFSLFRKKPLNIPPFADDIIKVERETTRWCQAQIGDYLGTGPQSLPDFGLNHDVMVGSYVCGFMQGQFMVGGQLNRWAKNDEGMASLGFSMLVGPCLASILGTMERSLAAMDYLPRSDARRKRRGYSKWIIWADGTGCPTQKGSRSKRTDYCVFTLKITSYSRRLWALSGPELAGRNVYWSGVDAGSTHLIID